MRFSTLADLTHFGSGFCSRAVQVNKFASISIIIASGQLIIPAIMKQALVPRSLLQNLESRTLIALQT
jgi:hypothetical protein